MVKKTEQNWHTIGCVYGKISFPKTKRDFDYNIKIKLRHIFALLLCEWGFVAVDKRKKNLIV